MSETVFHLPAPDDEDADTLCGLVGEVIDHNPQTATCVNCLRQRIALQNGFLDDLRGVLAQVEAAARQLSLIVKDGGTVVVPEGVTIGFLTVMQGGTVQ